MFTKITQWFIYSSANPQEFALTLKAGIPFIMLLGLGKYISAGDASSLIDQVVNGITLVGQLVAGVMATYGLVRKIYLSIVG